MITWSKFGGASKDHDSTLLGRWAMQFVSCIASTCTHTCGLTLFLIHLLLHDLSQELLAWPGLPVHVLDSNFSWLLWLLVKHNIIIEKNKLNIQSHTICFFSRKTSCFYDCKREKLLNNNNINFIMIA